MKKALIVMFCIALSVLFFAFAGCDSKDTTNENNIIQENTSMPEAEATPMPSGKEVTFDLSNVTQKKDIIVDKQKINELASYTYDGLGIIGANNSSRLLLDYKSENPEAYWEILNYAFGKDGMNLSLLKIEMGADVDSSSGTEPAVKRSIDEIADVTRGANYQLAADAKTINPDLQIDMLYWGIPSWVAEAEDKYDALYRWYKETIDALYDTYGIKVDYITVTQNEKLIDNDWIKYCSQRLKAEIDERYDYNSIKIVAGEAVGGFGIAQSMIKDIELMNAVDIVTAHYTSWISDSAETVQKNNDKRVWFSEGSSPMNAGNETYLYDGNYSGLSGLNGTLDIATRITQAMAEGMTMYEFQPAISSYYSGVTYYPKQLITANEPWCGSYTLDPGFYMVLHFSQFIQPGWKYIDEACFGDGVAGGDGHAIVDSTFNYITCVDPETEDYSSVIVNNSNETIAYTFYIKSLATSDAAAYIWETRGPGSENGNYKDNYFKKLGYVIPEHKGPYGYSYTVVVKPYSIITVSTLDVQESVYSDKEDSSSILSLPYTDDFEYKGYSEGFLESRGMAPRYTTDQDGAFEVESVNGSNVLMQKITYDIKPVGWGGLSDPITNLGDDRWSNYSVSIMAHFTDEKAENDKTNYVGLGARYILANRKQSGYWIKLSEDGTCEIMKNNLSVASTKIYALDITEWHKIQISVYRNNIDGYIDDELVISYVDDGAVIISGRASIYSNLQNNYFDDFAVTPIDGVPPTITRMNDLNKAIQYSEGSTSEIGNGWYFNTMVSFRNFERTVSTGGAGDSVTFSYEGGGFAIIGALMEATIEVIVDGEIVEDNYVCIASPDRAAGYYNFDIANGSHTVTINILEGNFAIDAIEFFNE